MTATETNARYSKDEFQQHVEEKNKPDELHCLQSKDDEASQGSRRATTSMSEVSVEGEGLDFRAFVCSAK